MTNEGLFQSEVDGFGIDPIDLSAWRSMESEITRTWAPLSLQRTNEKDELAAVRLENAEATLNLIDPDGAFETANIYYSAGITAQMALTAFLLHRGFDDHWCARNIGLRITAALDWANAAGLDYLNPGICDLALKLTPYWKWRRFGSKLLGLRDRRFRASEIHEILSNLLEHTANLVAVRPTRVFDQNGLGGLGE